MTNSTLVKMASWMLGIVLLFSVLLLLTNAEEVRDLTPTEFTSVVFSKPSLVKFFAPWCKHCQALAPIYEDAAKSIHQSSPNVQLVAVNCVDFSSLCDTFSVRSYPTLYYIRPFETDEEIIMISKLDDKAVAKLPRFAFQYEGPRNSFGFEQFITDPQRWRRVTKVPYPLPVSEVSMELDEPSREVRAEKNAREAVNKEEIAAGRGPVAAEAYGSVVSLFRFVLMAIGIMVIGGAVYLAYSGYRTRDPISSKAM